MNRNPTLLLDEIRSAKATEPLLVDFDETLFLRNSTEEYLQSAKPRFLAVFLLKLLDYIQPWRIWGDPQGKAVRDWVRVMTLTLLFPWTLLLWRQRCHALAQRFENRDLSQAIAANHLSPIIVASNGFDFIIRPLLSRMQLPWHQLIACRAWMGAIDRCRGKKQLVEQQLGLTQVRSSLLVTDSLDDEPLLQTVKRPHLVTWSIDAPESSLPRGYIPFFYMEKVKKTNQNFFIKAIIIDEFIPLVILLSWPQSHPVLHGLGLGLMLLSFWCIYEIGYMENDVIAEKYESQPTLSDQYLNNKDRINFYRPWVWSFALAFPGLMLWYVADRIDSLGFQDLWNLSLLQLLSLQLSIWGLFLLVTRAVYCLYNYVDERSRVWLYPILQVLKFAGFFFFTPANPLAIIYLICLVNSRWVPYFIYRYGNLASFPYFPMQLVHFFGVVSFTLLLWLCGIRAFVPLQLGLVLLMVTVRASKQMKTMVRNATFFPSLRQKNLQMQDFAALLFPKV